jgi:hypothetical protein
LIKNVRLGLPAEEIGWGKLKIFKKLVLINTSRNPRFLDGLFGVVGGRPLTQKPFTAMIAMTLFA